jgi:signal transduction histidine kinase
MQTNEVVAIAGAIALGTLSVLHALAWRAQRQDWSLQFALAFGFASLIYAFDAQARPPGMEPHPIAMLLGAAAMLLGAWGLIDYVGLPEPLRSRLRAGIAVALVAFVAWRFAGGTSRLGGFAIYAAVIGLLAGLAGWAMRREPRRGHGFVLLALALFPVAVASAAFGWIEVGVLRYLLIVPTAVLGMTVLTTGLLRAQHRAQVELERRQEAEAQLRRLNESLEHRVAERTGELAAMVAGLESFNRSVSHDLRGPLGGIASATRMALEALENGNVELVRRVLPLVCTQAAASAELVTALLALARVGDSELAPRVVDLEKLVGESLEQIRLTASDDAPLPVAVRNMPSVSADPGLLRQVFVNLVDNAIKFSRDVDAPQVEIGALVDDGESVLYVRDNGIGFASTDAARLYEPFQRLHGQRFQGSGVGLSIVKRVVERHGGRLWAESAPGRGATFYFTLGRPQT